MRDGEAASDPAKRHAVENGERQIDVTAEGATDGRQIRNVDRTIAWRDQGEQLKL